MRAVILRVRVLHLYEDGRVELFEGTPRAVRALLLRYGSLLHRPSAHDALSVVDQLARLETLDVGLVVQRSAVEPRSK